MKTQIIRYVILVVIASFISFGSNSYNTNINMHRSFTFAFCSKQITVDVTISASTKKFPHTKACIQCHLCSDKSAMLIIPEPNGEHEFHSFHVKHKTSKYLSFLKNVANKLLEVVYYIVVLIAYIPFKR